MDERATFLVPDRGLDSRSYPLVVKVLDGMPSSVWALFQGVVDDVGPDDGRFEDPAVGKVPAQPGANTARPSVTNTIFPANPRPCFSCIISLSAELGLNNELFFLNRMQNL